MAVSLLPLAANLRVPDPRLPLDLPRDLLMDNQDDREARWLQKPLRLRF